MEKGEGKERLEDGGGVGVGGGGRGRSRDVA